MSRRLLRRGGQFAATFLGVTLLTFVLLHTTPGDPSFLSTDSRGIAPEALRAAWRALRGLDAPWPTQYLTWLLRVLTFDFGLSFADERPVAALIVEVLPRTLAIMVPALVLTYVVALPLGTWLAVREGRPSERLVSSLLVLGYSVPTFWTALLALLFLASGEVVALFPLRGLTSPGSPERGVIMQGLDLGWHLVLPVLCLSYPGLCRTARLQRIATREVLAQDYILAARARGLAPWRIWLGHALPNALLPSVALVALDLPWLIGGSVIIERIFTIHGMGLLTFDAMVQRNYPVVMGVTTVTAVATLVGMLVADLALHALDPRLRLPGRS